MPLTILSDDDVRAVLDTLTRQDVLELHKALADALHSYSTATNSEQSGCCAANQPSRLVLKRQDGSVALFMPAMSDDAMGVKVLTVSESSSSSKNALASEVQSLNLSDRTPSPAGSSSPARTPTPSITSSTPVDSSASFTSATSAPTSAPLAESLKEPLGLLTPSDTSPKGSITLLEDSGQPRALINASTLTAFRTALASTLLLKARQNCHTLTVFGAGLQAYWHIFVTLLLRGDEIHHLHLINRDFTRAQRLLMTLGQSDNDAVASAFLTKKLRPSVLTPIHGEYHRLLKAHVRAADVIYCCTPSTTPLFPAGHLTNTEGRKKARYIAAIGSYKPHMQELHEDVLRQAVAGPGENSGNHSPIPHIHLHQRHAHEGGAVVVDTIEGAMKEAGEVIKAGISGQGIVELGELVMLKRSHWAEKAEKERLQRENGKATKNSGHGLAHLFHPGGGQDRERDKEERERVRREQEDGGLRNWLERGNVIYKSVGLGLMDVVVGMGVVRLAEERGFGTRVQGF